VYLKYFSVSYKCCEGGWRGFRARIAALISVCSSCFCSGCPACCLQVDSSQLASREHAQSRLCWLSYIRQPTVHTIPCQQGSPDHFAVVVVAWYSTLAVPHTGNHSTHNKAERVNSEMSAAAGGGRLVPIPPPSQGGGSVGYGDDDEECTDELIDRILENYQFHFKPETRIKLKQRCAAGAGERARRVVHVAVCQAVDAAAVLVRSCDALLSDAHPATQMERSGALRMLRQAVGPHPALALHGAIASTQLSFPRTGTCCMPSNSQHLPSAARHPTPVNPPPRPPLAPPRPRRSSPTTRAAAASTSAACCSCRPCRRPPSSHPRSG